MTGRIIPLHGDLHDETSALLPWYVTGRLDDDERARVDLHLKTCTQCQADLADERALHARVADLAEEPTTHVDAGWAQMRDLLREEAEPVDHRPIGRHVSHWGQSWNSSAPWLRWAVAAQFTLLFVAAGALGWQATHTPSHAQDPAQYHALGAAPESTAGNLVVIFRPDTREDVLRQTLRDNRARVVDGPTVTDAYVLHVAPADRDATVVRLRRQPVIVLAEPVNAGDRAP